MHFRGFTTGGRWSDNERSLRHPEIDFRSRCFSRTTGGTPYRSRREVLRMHFQHEQMIRMPADSMKIDQILDNAANGPVRDIENNAGIFEIKMNIFRRAIRVNSPVHEIQQKVRSRRTEPARQMFIVVWRLYAAAELAEPVACRRIRALPVRGLIL